MSDKHVILNTTEHKINWLILLIISHFDLTDLTLSSSIQFSALKRLVDYFPNCLQ